MDSETAAIITQSKSTGVAVLLTIMFGGVGLFYASIFGGIVIGILELLAVIITFLTVGFGVVLFPIIHFIALIWAIVAVGGHNKRLVARARA